jgi:DNA-binding MarR family transcriptional regulator
MGVTPQVVASLADRLKGPGQVERRTHPRPRRVQELHLTAAGRAVLRLVGDMVSEIEQKITEQLRYADTAMLRALLDRVAVAAHEL